MILSTASRIQLIIDDLNYDGVAGMSAGGEIAFPSSAKRKGEYDALIDGKNCKILIDSKRWQRDHQFLYGRQID